MINSQGNIINSQDSNIINSQDINMINNQDKNNIVRMLNINSQESKFK